MPAEISRKNASRDETVGDVLRGFVRHPVSRLVVRWNWKTALLSSIIRSSLFFAMNLSAGLDAARAAMLTELVFRAVTSGYHGALTAAFRHARPHWAATAAVLVLLPLCNHTIEWLVHWTRGTVRLWESIGASMMFTVVSTLYNLFVMRQGALVVGDDGRSLVEDLRRMPRLTIAFVVNLVQSAALVVRAVARWRTKRSPFFVG
jgi:hypothetical protein